MKSHHSQEFRDLLHPGSDRLMLREVPTTGGVGRTVLQPGARHGDSGVIDGVPEV